MSFDKGWKSRRNAALARRADRGGKVARYREASLEMNTKETISMVFSMVEEEHKKLVDQRSHLESELQKYRNSLARGEMVSGFNPIVQQLEDLLPKIAAAEKALKPARAQFNRDMQLHEQRMMEMKVRHEAEIAAEAHAEAAATAAVDALFEAPK